jgi:hypothetical protein
LETLEGDSAKVDMGEVGSSEIGDCFVEKVNGCHKVCGEPLAEAILTAVSEVEGQGVGEIAMCAVEGGATFSGDARFDGTTFTADAFGATLGRPPAFDNALFKKGVPASVAHYRSAEGTDEQA